MATLEQIAAALKAADAAGNVDDARRLAAAYRELQASSAQEQPAQPQQAPAPSAAQPQQQTGLPTDLMTSTAATVNGLVQSIPFLQNVTDMAGGGIAQLMGGDYQEYIDRQQQLRGQIAQAAPLARGAGEIAGLVAAPMGAATTRVGAEALGLTGSLLQRSTNSALSGAGLATADALQRGETGTDALMSGAIGGTVGGLIPGVGAAARAAGRGIKDRLITPVATMMSPENAVTANLSKVVGSDMRTGSVMSAADQRLAEQAGIPVMNADRFGPATRRLARTASNIDDDAKSMFSRAVEDRFNSQSARADNFVTQLMGGATDDLALKEALRTGSEKANAVGYQRAFSDPKAADIFTPRIQQLMQSPMFRQAVQGAESRAADRAAISGFQAVKNPFTQAADGSFQLAGNARPTLQFWDQVKRNLDEMIDAARPTPLGGGNRTRWADLTQIKQALVGELDNTVKSYKAARGVAAEFFGADDAIDVGRKAFRSTRNLPEQQRVVNKMTDVEKKAASVGYASEMLDEIRAYGDNRNIAIAQFFNSPAARARNELYLGKFRARQLEAYVKLESAVDLLRGAVKGNSSTAEQLIAAGAVGTGVGMATGDWQSGLTAGAIAGLGMRALRAAGKKVDERVMRGVAEALLSTDPKVMERAIQNASLSQQHMDAIDAIMRGIGAGARGAAAGTIPAMVN